MIYETTDTGVDAPGTTLDVRLVAIDLDDFGLGAGDTNISTIQIETAPYGNDWHTPDIPAIGANLISDGDNEPRVASVPLPSAAFLGMGLLAAGFAARALRRRRRG